MTMSHTLTCGCGQQLAIRPEFFGKQIQCPMCQRIIVVPLGQPGTYGQPGMAGQQFQTPGHQAPMQGGPFHDPLGGFGGLPQQPMPSYQPTPNYSYGAPAAAQKRKQDNSLIWMISGIVGVGALLIVGLVVGLIWFWPGQQQDATILSGRTDDMYSQAQRSLAGGGGSIQKAAPKAETKKEWGVYESQEGGYSVNIVLPVKPLSDAVPFATGDNVKHTMTSSYGESNFTVNHIDLAGQVLNVDAQMDALANQLVKQVTMLDGALVSNNRISYGNHTGRDLIIDARAPILGDVTYRFRVYFVPNRLHVLSWQGPRGAAGGQDALRFLDSFRLLNDPAGGSGAAAASSATPAATGNSAANPASSGPVKK